MSHEGSFDAAISHLTNRMNSRGEGSEREELRQSIRALEDWPKWQPLIEAAGKVDKKMTFMALEDLPLAGFSAQNIIRNQLYSLIEALPEPGKEEK